MAICRNFLWDGSSEYHRVPLVSWDTVTLAKEEGGLGIKNAALWNVASVDKLVNWIYSKADRLWIKWVNAIYIKQQNWHDYSCPADTTWVWKSICKVKEKLKTGYVNDEWLINGRGYTNKDGYGWLQSSKPQQKWSNIIWNHWNIPKHAIVTWLRMQGGMNVKSKLYRIGCIPDDLCLLCQTQSETIDHVFTSCPYSIMIQNLLQHWYGGTFPSVQCLSEGNMKDGRWKIRVALLNAYHYHVWYQRNSARMAECILRPGKVMEQIIQEVKCRVKYKARVDIHQADVDWLCS